MRHTGVVGFMEDGTQVEVGLHTSVSIVQDAD
jgi:hypothetical protein